MDRLETVATKIRQAREQSGRVGTLYIYQVEHIRGKETLDTIKAAPQVNRFDAMVQVRADLIAAGKWQDGDRVLALGQNRAVVETKSGAKVAAKNAEKVAAGPRKGK